MNEDIVAIHRLKQGDIGGLETLVLCYQVKAIRAAFLVVWDEQLAEDIVQDAFLRLCKHIRSFDESRPFEPYLLRSVVNVALDAAQKSVKHEQGLAEIETAENLIQHAVSVENQVEFNAMKREISMALEKLTPRQRAAIVMRYFLGINEKEMAEELQAPPGTIKWLLNAARGRLRKLLPGRSVE